MYSSFPASSNSYASHYFQTPLHLAIITKQAQMVQMLKDAGASVNYPDRKGNSAVHLAAARKDVEMLKLLTKFNSPIPDFNAKNFAGAYRICGVTYKLHFVV